MKVRLLITSVEVVTPVEVVKNESTFVNDALVCLNNKCIATVNSFTMYAAVPVHRGLIYVTG
jgi:hypothetical protein